ncbi:MAG: glycosyltransferase family 2 protein [Candidatus Pristimantibacillus sp.]
MIIQLSVCICTRNRPEDLEKALNSIYKSSIPAYEIIVSDDSTDARTREMIQHRFDNVIFTEGPRKGLCPNRNHILKQASGTHLLFMDDDEVMDEQFIEMLTLKMNQIDKLHREKVILTGIEYGHGVTKVYPKDQSFLGYQTKVYKGTDKLNTVVLGSAIFPKTLFDLIHFDEQLVYGYDEVDISTRAVKYGYEILLCEEAFNNHYSSPVNRDFYKPVLEASRFYVTFKRYAFTEKLMVKGYLFFITACGHMLLSDLKNKGFSGLKDATKTMNLSLEYIRKFRETEVNT